ncbi:hypothetical protein [Corynebacterium ureicelerivorans]|uniref:hypothetical protein n=1 Tax=Corynebacterium ureicelerivorans TaxID=401472 RepID=UPI00206B1EF0|nr:hypothetical protein [Corynebacterium ureicelerivorans]DAI68003.1 MAG TPA: hypothetical protein [Caudoviricetes sp.]
MELPTIDQDRPSRYETFARQLDHAAETNPPEKSWLKFPRQTDLTPGTRSVYRWRINAGELLGPGYEAATRAGWLYARKRP